MPGSEFERTSRGTPAASAGTRSQGEEAVRLFIELHDATNILAALQ